MYLQEGSVRGGGRCFSGGNGVPRLALEDLPLPFLVSLPPKLDEVPIPGKYKGIVPCGFRPSIQVGSGQVSFLTSKRHLAFVAFSVFNVHTKPWGVLKIQILIR